MKYLSPKKKSIMHRDPVWPQLFDPHHFRQPTPTLDHLRAQIPPFLGQKLAYIGLKVVMNRIWIRIRHRIRIQKSDFTGSGSEKIFYRIRIWEKKIFTGSRSGSGGSGEKLKKKILPDPNFGPRSTRIRIQKIILPDPDLRKKIFTGSGSGFCIRIRPDPKFLDPVQHYYRSFIR